MINVPGGVLHCARSGSGPPVVLLHGIQGTSAAWETVASALSDEYTVITPDFRGRSPSFIPSDPEDYTLERFAEDFRCVLDTLDEPALVVAWSMGGLVLLEHLKQHGSDGINGAVLTGTTAFPGTDAQWFTGSTVESITDEAIARARMLQLAPVAEPHAVAATWWHARHADYRALLPTITIPMLIAHGARDHECPPSHGEFLAQRLADARLDMWPEAGHNLMSHDPHRFVRMIRDFAPTLLRAG